MPDGSLGVDRWANPRPLPFDSRALAKEFWRSKPSQLPPEPIEHERGGLVVCVESAAGSPQFHSGASVTDTIGQWTLMFAALYRLIDGVDAMTFLPKGEIEAPDPPPEGQDARMMAAGLDAHGSAIHDVQKPLANKEMRRKRRRSRLIRNGNAPQVDRRTFPPPERWAADMVNLIARKRYAPPECERVDATGRPYGATTWLKYFTPEARGMAAWIFRHVAHHGGGEGLGKKFNARTIVEALAAANFPANMQIDGDVPTPLVKGERFLVSQNLEEHETNVSATIEPTCSALSTSAA